MPEYLYRCTECGQLHNRCARMGEAPVRVKCGCGRMAARSFRDECQHVVTDPEMCTADFNDNVAARKEDRDAKEPCLARSLARVPGVPKVRGADGRIYGAFRNRQHRRRVMEQLHIHEE